MSSAELVLCCGLEGGLCLHIAFRFPEFFSKSTLTTAVHFHFFRHTEKETMETEIMRRALERECVYVCACVLEGGKMQGSIWSGCSRRD